MTAPTILVVDDEPGMLRYIETLLELESFRVETVRDGAQAIERLQHDPLPSLVLLDVLMPGLDGLQTLEQLRRLHPWLKVVMLSCVTDSRKVVQAMRMGAQDYLTKPFEQAELLATIEMCLGRSQSAAAAHTEEIEDLGDGIFFIAATPAMHKLRNQAKLVANVDIPVLLLGESGSGKEVLAKLIHKYSPRAHRTFLKVNCAAVPSDLLESELFGYEPGAFTGATHAKPGKFELCNKGTILLDEIGEMSFALQAKLLHVLQDQQFARLGGRNTIQVDVRILAATNIDVQQAMASKKLREDLYYRLNGFTLHLPPLRERKEEIPILLKHFMQQVAEHYARPALPITPTLLQACHQYHWPGNLRELGNFVKRYLILADEEMAVSELRAVSPDKGRAAAAAVGAGIDTSNARNSADNLKALLRDLKGAAETEAIAKALEQTHWNRRKAAEMLNISYKALLYKIKQYDIRRKPDSD